MGEWSLEWILVSVCEPTLSETSFMYLFFMVTLLGRFYSLKFTDETMRPLGPYVIDPELESGFVLS